MKAMILAAGIGQRMQPLTRDWPKPALPVLDRPLVRLLVEQLAAQGVGEVVVNSHAHPDALRAALESSPIPVHWSAEPELLGSGGGIRAARSWLETDTFLVVNGDMLLDLDVAGLLDAHRASGACATLALREDPRQDDFGTIGVCSRDSGTHVSRITELIDQGGEQGCGLFIGVHAMEPEIFERMPDAREFESLRDVYVPMLRDGEAIGAWFQDPVAHWTPVGTPRELLDANLAALGSEPVWLGAGVEIAESAQVGPRAVIGAGVRVPESAQLCETLVLPGAKLVPGARLERAIAWDTEVWRDD